MFSDLRDQVLRPLCVTPLVKRQDQLHVLPPQAAPAADARDARIQGCERMLWQVALWASRGRVPLGTDLDAPVSLPNWPNFSRLLITPHAMQIAALWNERALSLKDTAKRLNIPYRYVFAFYSACLALGLIEKPERMEDAALAACEPQANEKRGLFGSLLRKLKLGR